MFIEIGGNYILSMKYTLTLFLVLTLLGCSKYEEGPDFSLRSKTARLLGEWTLLKYNGNAINGELILEFRRDNSLTLSESAPGYPKMSVDGNWDWINDKEDLTITTNGSVDTIQILRLTQSDFWFGDDSERFEFGKK
ncbi:MAG: hypothetical protein C0424_10810 [Sphingobacteriaceae bacterium]|nr:hypothetical protein [Sphingobacteriaceae bacterium]